jgi:hypothetical protein
MQAHYTGAAAAAAHTHHDTVVLDPRGHHLEPPIRLDSANRQ